MTALTFAGLDSATLRSGGEVRADRLRALRAMLTFAVMEAEALGDPELVAAIEDAVGSADQALTLDLGRPYHHDA